MRTVKIKIIFEAIIRGRGYDPLTAELSAAQQSDVAELVNERVIQAWQHAFWPELMIVQRRQYRATYETLTPNTEFSEPGPNVLEEGRMPVEHTSKDH